MIGNISDASAQCIPGIPPLDESKEYSGGQTASERSFPPTWSAANWEGCSSLLYSSLPFVPHRKCQSLIPNVLSSVRLHLVPGVHGEGARG